MYTILFGQPCTANLDGVTVFDDNGKDPFMRSDL